MIEVVQGRLVDARSEAILRPVGSDLMAVTAAGREVDLQAGDSVRRRLAALGEVPVGGAVVTPGGGVEVPFLIHAVVQSRDEAPTSAIVRLALTNGLRRAAEWEIRTLALPPLGVGVGQMDAEGAARDMVALLLEHMGATGFPATATVVTPGAYEAEVFRGALGALA